MEIDIKEYAKEYKKMVEEVEEQASQDQHDLMVFLARLEQEVPEDKLKASCAYVMKEMILNAQRKLDKEFSRYAELAKFNVPYKDRLEAINENRIQRLEKGIDYYKRILKNGFTVNPWRTFVFVGDEDYIKEFGLKSFIMRNIKYVINHNEQWEKNKQS